MAPTFSARPTGREQSAGPVRFTKRRWSRARLPSRASGRVDGEADTLATDDRRQAGPADRGACIAEGEASAGLLPTSLIRVVQLRRLALADETPASRGEEERGGT
jgi:hypothetical protein